ncbi:aminopeptidase N [Actinopolyspora mzabensis]|uniref:Aminopeptidase N n=1 Tax=Actinopolyspora mzabensis TaxID=995066 RepID=A0A1G9E8N9_ACTMZ|nr:aminopeptidase N [Actinopolyspora mzabensis]SDK72499.1 aminopeptidase N [Actinopolyspora mzabensis]
MAPPNLTRQQAEQRAELLRVHSYAIELDLSDAASGENVEVFGSKTTVRFAARQGTTTWIDLMAAQVHNASLNGVELDLSDYDEETGIALPELAEQNELVVRADCHYTNTGEGLHRFVDPVDGGVYLYSQFETADAKRMFACFDQPDLKANFQLTVTAPSTWRVVSNSPGEITASSETRNTHTFEATPPISTYLVALVAGPYAEWRDVYSGPEGEIPLGLYCRASLAEYLDPERLFTETKQGFGFYQRAFGVPYPFAKYDQCFVPEFNAGAMENAGCVTFLEDYVFRSRVTGYFYERRAETVLHEMAHMWFGDLVTMRWWDDLWLNESFATWASVLAQSSATEYNHAWTTFANVEKSWAYRQDQLPSTHPVAADIEDLQAVEVNFDGITYAKGASVLKQLVSYVGLENFLSGLKIYFDRHAWGNARLSDLLTALEEASGRDLSWWSAQWLETTGLNTVRPEFETDEQDRFTEFTVLQGPASPGEGEYRTHRIAVGVYDDDPTTGKLVRTHRVELDISGERTEAPELVGVPRGKLVLVNDDDLSYCTMRLDSRSLATLVERIADIDQSLPRALGWSTAWEMTRDAEMRARDFVSLVLGKDTAGGIGGESEIGVVQRVLMQARTALGAYADPGWQPEGWQRYTDRLLELARAARPGSDNQLAFVNALTAAKLDEDKLTLLRGWLDGSRVLEGLVVDTDLRWQLLHALVAHGAAEESEIDAELASDSTATGKRRAERARALIPTPEAKERAWQRAVHDDELPNAINEAIISGFQHPAQHELLTPYVRRYFDEIDEVWQRRSSERAQPTVMGLFPSWSVDPETVEAADAWLAGEHPSALRRLVSEGRAGVVRALTAREFDRS